MHHRHATTLEFFPRICDIILAEYNGSPIFMFSHAFAHLLTLN